MRWCRCRVQMPGSWPTKGDCLSRCLRGAGSHGHGTLVTSLFTAGGRGGVASHAAVHSGHVREVAQEALKRSREESGEGAGGAVGACAGQISITASQSAQTTDAYSSGYHGAPACSEGLQRALSIANVSLPQRVRGPAVVGVPGAVGAACTLRTGRSSSPGEPGEDRVATGLPSSYTTTMSLMPLP